MAERQIQIQIPERRDDEPPASAKQLQRIRQLTTGLSLQGYRFDYRKLGTQQADTILQQLNAMNDQQPPAAPRKQGPGCFVSLAKGTTTLIVWLVVLAGVAGGGYLIYWRMNQAPPNDDSAQADTTDSPNDTQAPSDGGNTSESNIFSGLGVSDSPSTPDDTDPDPADDKPDTATPIPGPEPAPPPATNPATGQQLTDLEEMLVQLSQYTRNDFAADLRLASSQAMQRKLEHFPAALAALDAVDPTLSPRIAAIIDAFAAETVDGPALRDDIKSIRDAINNLK